MNSHKRRGIINHLFFFGLSRWIEDNEPGLSCYLDYCKLSEDDMNPASYKNMKESDLLDMLKKIEDKPVGYLDTYYISPLESSLTIDIIREESLFWNMVIKYTNRLGLTDTSKMYNIGFSKYEKGNPLRKGFHAELSLLSYHDRKYDVMSYYDSSNKYHFADDYLRSWTVAIKEEFITSLKRIISENI
jgi:hypothetical protein